MKLSSNAATLLGVTSILQWGAQVLISTYAVVFPPFQIIAMTFLIAFCVMLAKWLWNRENILQYARHNIKVWAIGISGLFGYYFLFYIALNHAPAVEVTLLVNLWPLLMVLFSGFLPGERLRWYHHVGCLVGVAGSALLVGPNALAMFEGSHLYGQALAIAAAIIWAAFCVASRTIGNVPTDTVGWYCFATALLALICHVTWETTTFMVAPSAWWAVFVLGIGPIGLAFFAWDVGLKHGNIKLLGVMAFFIPMVSAILLIVAGRGILDWRVATAAVLITGGALIGAKNEIAALVRNLKAPPAGGTNTSPLQP